MVTEASIHLMFGSPQFLKSLTSNCLPRQPLFSVSAGVFSLMPVPRGTLQEEVLHGQISLRSNSYHLRL